MRGPTRLPAEERTANIVPMRTIRAAPIDAAAYGRYGKIVHAGTSGTARSANHGTAQAWDALAVIENLRGERARATASLFRCRALEGETLAVRWLERHPGSTQMFVPMLCARYLVVVALGADAPDLETLQAFVAAGTSAITYAPGTWHHPMVALEKDADFVNVIFADGTAGDCDECAFDPPAAIIEI